MTFAFAPPFRLEPINPQPGGVTRDGFVVFPNDILSYMQKVDAAMTSLEGDIVSSELAAKDQAFVSAWKNFLAGWKKFFDDHQPWYMRLNGSVYDSTEDYENNLDQWRLSFIARGGKASAPRSGKDAPDVAGAVKWAAAAAVVAVAGVLAFRFIPKGKA